MSNGDKDDKGALLSHNCINHMACNICGSLPVPSLAALDTVTIPRLAWEGFLGMMNSRLGLPANRDKSPAELVEMARAMLALRLPLCPKCGAEDSMEHHRVRFPDAPLDADWDQCAVCDYRTDPE